MTDGLFGDAVIGWPDLRESVSRIDLGAGGRSRKAGRGSAGIVTWVEQSNAVKADETDLGGCGGFSSLFLFLFLSFSF